jgi:DNA-binding CsgD family transcriptional regulator/PAS domain-containing protein
MIGKIYDCAVDPDLWISTLSDIRELMDLAFLQVNFIDHACVEPGQTPGMVTFQTPWDPDWITSLAPLIHTIPGGDAWFSGDIDTPVSQMELTGAEEFRKSEFFQAWVKPQGLGDTLNTPLIKRDGLIGMTVAASYEKRSLFDDADRLAFQLLSPHVRRALLIGGMLDEGRLQFSLYRDLLDRVTTGVLIVSDNARMIYANAAADRLLSDGSHLTARAGRIVPAYSAYAPGFNEALARACSQNDSDIGTFGNGIPLPAKDGTPAVCYVLPLGRSERRRALGPGLAALFVSNSSASTPPSLEILSALSGLTSRESRVALLIAGGKNTDEVAQSLGISMNTMRTHLAHVFQKTNVNSQQALAHFVNSLNLPIAARDQRL